MAEPLAKPENKFRTFYHGTYPGRIEGILRAGLDPNYSGQGGGTLPGLNEKDPRPKIFLTTSPSYAKFYARMAAGMEAQAKAKEEGKGWIRQRLAQGTPAPPLRIDLPSDFKVNELASFLGTDEHYVTDLIPPEYIKASNDLTALAPKWSERGHLLAALPKHLADAQEAIKSQQNIDKEMTDLSLIASAWLKSQQQKELLETRLKRFKETAGYPSMASILASPVVVGSTNKEQAMNNLNKAAEFGSAMGKMAGGVVDLGKGSHLYSDKERYEPGSNARFSLTWGEEHMKEFEDAIMDHAEQLNREDALRVPRNNPKYDIQEKDLEDYDKIINWLPANTQAPHREKLNLLKTPSRADMSKSARVMIMAGNINNPEGAGKGALVGGGLGALGGAIYGAIRPGHLNYESSGLDALETTGPEESRRSYLDDKGNEKHYYVDDKGNVMMKRRGVLGGSVVHGLAGGLLGVLGGGMIGSFSPKSASFGAMMGKMASGLESYAGLVAPVGGAILGGGGTALYDYLKGNKENRLSRILKGTAAGTVGGVGLGMAKDFFDFYRDGKPPYHSPEHYRNTGIGAGILAGGALGGALSLSELEKAKKKNNTEASDLFHDDDYESDRHADYDGGSSDSFWIEEIDRPLSKAASFRDIMGKMAASDSKPGLWANIRAKKERGESAAKPGDKDYPDSKNWKKVTAISEKKAETPAWQRSEGKNPDGGLNNKGRASLKAEGKNIKRPQPEGGSRRDSFCARMGGMKSKLTSESTANDPDSRINKALRKWNC